MEYVVKPDQMTPRERMDAFASGEDIDRIPCCPILGETCAPIFGIWPAQHNHSSELMAKVEVEVFRMFRPDGAGIGTGLRGVAEAMGTELEYPENGVSYVKRPALKSYEDLGKIKPANPRKDGRLPLILDALKMIDDEIGRQVEVSTDIAGPFSVAAAVRGTENLLRDLRKNPKELHYLLEIITESNIRFIDEACNMGFGVGFSDPVASQSMISVPQFDTFVKPYMKKCMDRIRKWRGSGGGLHICGKSKGIWEAMVECGISTLSIDNIEDLQDAKDMVGDRVVIMGNVRPVETIKMGSVQDIYEESRQCIVKGGDSPNGFILSSGCQIPIGTPPENIKALMDAARIFGKK